MQNEEQIKALHSVYCAESRFPLELTMQRKFTWEEFATKFNADDLTLVLKNLRREVRDGRRSNTCLGFRKLIGDLENFEEHLAQFRALLRRPQFAPGKADVLRATGRATEPEQEPASSFATNMERKRLGDMLAAFRKKLDEQPPDEHAAKPDQSVLRGSKPGTDRTITEH